MLPKNLIRLFLAVTISSAVYGEELQSLCGKTNMEVANKSFSFTWTIAGYGDRLNDTSQFKLSTEPITFSETVETKLWKFHLRKRPHGVISLSAVASVKESQETGAELSTDYTVTPEITVGDQVIQLASVFIRNNPSPTKGAFNAFDHHNIRRQFNDFANKFGNFTNSVHLMSGQNRLKRMAASPDKYSYHSMPTIPGNAGFPWNFPGHTPSKTFSWHNILHQLTKLLAQADNSQEMKIKFSILATISSNEFSTVDCS